MPEFIVTPFLEPDKNRMETKFRMPFKLAEDRDVARVANLLAQISRVENEFGLEIMVFFGARQKAQINPNAQILQRIINKSGMAAFIPRHDRKKLLHIRIFDALLDLRIQNAPGKFGCHAAHQKIH